MIKIIGFTKKKQGLTLGEPMFDGVAEFGFESPEMFQKWLVWFTGDGGRPLRDDEENFVDHATRVAVIVKERTFIR
jgi:hypothetical protein